MEAGTLPSDAESAGINLELASASVNAPVADLTPVLPRLRLELDRLGLKQTRLAIDNSIAVQGRFEVTADDGMGILIGASLDPQRTLRHEAMHALREMGLFEPAEWTALMREAERLTQAFLIVLDNAIKYSDRGARVDVVLRGAPRETVVSVRNSGAEIPASDLPFVFHRFYRGHQAEGRTAGRPSAAGSACRSPNGSPTPMAAISA